VCSSDLVLWSLATGLVTLACFLLLYLLGVNPLKMLKTRLPHETIQIVFYFITGGLIAPLAEEVFFRGVLFGFLRTWGFAFALCVSTAIFASFHVLFSGQIFPVTQIAGGLLFAISFEKENLCGSPSSFMPQETLQSSRFLCYKGTTWLFVNKDFNQKSKPFEP
jgi:membrane protease YdiL (CAAX protease family)